MAMGCLSSCGDYLDVVPDNVATIDYAFRMRATAEQYLFTCYSYMPLNEAVFGADDMWSYREDYTNLQIAKGNQSVVSPLIDYWSGSRTLWRGVRDCNIFIENIGLVKDMDQYEKDRWIAEVKVLKAYYHYYLLRNYGPIPLIRENLPISAGVEETQLAREPFDDCVDYIVQLLDEAAQGESLPVTIENKATELGRITRPVALALKAKVLVTAASPLFNGNADYAGLTNKDGTKLFNATYDVQKWDRAAKACKEAIDLCHEASHQLYTYSMDLNSANVSRETYLKMSIRNSFTAKWNPEIIWSTLEISTISLQQSAQARLDASSFGASSTNSTYAPTMKMAELFYTKNGVPIQEDNTWDYAGRYNLRTAVDAEKNYIQLNYRTASLHFDREPRFYADLAFDGSKWYGQGRLSEADAWHVEAKVGQYSGGTLGTTKYSITGYWPKKLVNPLSVYSSTANYQAVNYPWPVIRLADLYLLYAEALNELNGPGEEIYEYLNLVRERAGLKTVEESWSQYSNNPTKYQNQSGLREIIQQERAIELAFEEQRFYDLRRWKTAMSELNKPIYGWDINQSEAELYYRPVLIFEQKFRMRDYLWPIRELDLVVNPKLVQNPGW
ncbi:MAG: RagB/SusD family nutrient uptake outer membrane protein [Mangrovibacterium sp.]